MSRAKLLDLPQDEETETAEQNEAQEPQMPDPVQDQAEEETQEQPNIPEKYRGKTLEEVVQMHQEAEKALGKQGSEVGELRKVVDEYIQSQQPAAPQQHVEPEEDDDLDYFTDPEAAVARAIERHPAVQEAKQMTLAQRKQVALSQLESKHPDMREILQDPKFAEWIQASNVRKRLFAQSDQEYDFEAADELFSNWKERQNIVQQTAQVEKQARKQSLKSASTGTTRGGNAAPGRKIYRRADLIKLMKEDPARYTALQDEIFAAYQEGRVR